MGQEGGPYHRWVKELLREFGPERGLREFLTQAIPLYVKGTDAEVRILWDRASAAAGNPQSQETFLRQAQRAAAALRDETAITRTDLKLSVWMLQRSPTKAAALLEAVVKRARALSHDPLRLQAKALINLGLARMKLERYDETIELCRKAEELLDPGDCDDRRIAELNIGWSWLQLGEDEEGAEHTRIAAALFQRLGQSDTTVLRNLASYHVRRRQYTEAQRQLNEAVRAAGSNPNDQIGVLLDQAEVAALAGDLDSASQAASKAKGLIKSNSAIVSQDDAHLLLVESRIHEARGQLTEAEAGYRKVFNEGATWGSMRLGAASRRAALLWRAHRQLEAETQFKQADDLLEKMRANLGKDESKLGFFEDSSFLFDRYVDLLVSGKKYELALTVADGSRARLLADYQEKVKPLSLPELRKQLGESVALFYWIGGEKSYLFIVDPKSKAMVEDAIDLRLQPGKLRELAEVYSKAVASGFELTRQQRDVGCELRQAILGPASPHLTQDRRVFMVLDGPLGLINPESLPSADCGNHEAWLINEVNVSVAPSLAVLQVPAPKRKGSGALLAIGDADGTKDYPRLPNAGDELKIIAKQMPAGRSKIVQGALATPAAYMTGNPAQYELIHFTAHGEAKSNNPLDSAVVLSEDPETKAAKLYARDIIGRRIGARLVTISACKSAVSRTYRGEGAVGLAWAFLRAGAGHVVAGLWNVDDQSARELMPMFYGNLHRGFSPADALREAKLELMKGYKKPYDWAVFELFAGYVEPADLNRH